MEEILYKVNKETCILISSKPLIASITNSIRLAYIKVNKILQKNRVFLHLIAKSNSIYI